MRQIYKSCSGEVTGKHPRKEDVYDYINNIITTCDICNTGNIGLIWGRIASCCRYRCGDNCIVGTIHIYYVD